MDKVWGEKEKCTEGVEVEEIVVNDDVTHCPFWQGRVPALPIWAANLSWKCIS